MSVSYKTAIKYKNFLISVKMIKVNKENNIELNQLCKNSKERVRYKKYCPSCDKEITNEDIIKGYEYSENRYVTLSTTEIESLKTEDDKKITIKYFCKPKEIDNLLIKKSYYLIPEINSEINYSLFYKVLSINKIVGIAEIVLGTKQELIMLDIKDNCIIASVLFYQDEINEIPNMYNHKIMKSDYMELRDLVHEDIKKFDWYSHFDKYQKKLRYLIISKIPK
jgi:DNA end-binding protein Ku